jgi:hypothetical protein
VLIDGTPEIVQLAVNLQEHLILSVNSPARLPGARGASQRYKVAITGTPL